MRTVVIPPPGVFGFGRSRTAQVGHLPTDAELAAIVAQLAAEGIPVGVRRSGSTLDLRPAGPVTTRQEVRAIAAAKARTNCRITWHAALETPAGVR